jgi:hypothetical protein
VSVLLDAKPQMGSAANCCCSVQCSAVQKLCMQTEHYSDSSMICCTQNCDHRFKVEKDCGSSPVYAADNCWTGVEGSRGAAAVLELLLSWPAAAPDAGARAAPQLENYLTCYISGSSLYCALLLVAL